MSVLNPKTNRMVKVGTAAYKRAVREGHIKTEPTATTEDTSDDEEMLKPKQKPKQKSKSKQKPDSDSESSGYNEIDLKTRMSEISTDMIKSNMKKIVKSRQLTPDQLDVLLKKMLYKKLCVDDQKPKPKKPKKKPKKPKKPKLGYRQARHFQSESESSESSSESTS